MTTQDLIEFGEWLALDLMETGQTRKMTPKELLMALTMCERMLQSVLFPGNPMGSRNAVMEGHSTFDAISDHQVEN